MRGAEGKRKWLIRGVEQRCSSERKHAKLVTTKPLMKQTRRESKKSEEACEGEREEREKTIAIMCFAIGFFPHQLVVGKLKCDGLFCAPNSFCSIWVMSVGVLVLPESSSSAQPGDWCS